MRLFKSKPEEPKIKFSTALDHSIELVPPVPMRKALPKWWKDTSLKCPVPHKTAAGPLGPPPIPGAPLPPPLEMHSVKACAGIYDIMRWGYMVPLWCDYKITTYPDSDETGRWDGVASTPDMKSTGFMAEHSLKMPHRKGEYAFSIKLDSPWLIQTPPGWSLALLPLPFGDNEFKQPWRVIPGIIDTDRYHNFNVLVKWSFEGEYIIEQGTPMCQIVPFKRDTTELEAEFEYVTREESARLSAKGKGGTGNGFRHVALPYQRDRKRWDAVNG